MKNKKLIAMWVSPDDKKIVKQAMYDYRVQSYKELLMFAIKQLKTTRLNG